ncbi:universal stress protein [Novosphingobium aquimarinum]|uniref:universal stress protein n=1 Tax=Novosphingobium aquimarinum TaxID=2682494 RepID=UPI0012EBC91A|nr:universal stress protein [Novosphingobium aquimarinum]
MKSILVSADGPAGFNARLETALSLARSIGGHVTALVNMPIAAHVVMDPMGGTYFASEALDRIRDDRDQRAEAVKARLAREDVAFDVLSVEGDPVESLASAARFADVVVVSRGEGLAGDLALTATIPVIRVADDAPLAFPIEKACIAWNGSEEAAFALRSAVPLLSRCGTVDLITVIDQMGGFPAADALRYLSRHDIHAQLQEIERRGSTEETLAVAVGLSGASLLVMGAFGKSRMREFLFGGVTAHFLDGTGPLALFLAH